MNTSPLIHVVDRDLPTRDALSTLFGSVQWHARYYEDGADFLQGWERSRPGCILLDLRLPDMSGLELQMLLRRQEYCPPIVFLTAHGDIPSAVLAMRGGALDFFAKPVHGESLLKSVRHAINVDLERRGRALQRATAKARLALLTPRERQVLDCVAAGKPNKETGRELNISHKTVELHRSRVMAKLRAESLVQLIEVRLAAGEWAAEAACRGARPRDDDGTGRVLDAVRDYGEAPP